ncbi:MAG TPA: beta-ketoacyl-ACP synthase II [candidate division Zixibacteria bacterium]|nr:beta-ketoacyl-ACP synthase II [candidate division Zixibacteria bacterium]
MNRRVVITGLGTFNPLGNDPETTWDMALAGKSGIGLITSFDTRDFKTRIAGELKSFDPVALFGQKEARRMDRVTQMALASADQAIEDADLKDSGSDLEMVGVVLGVGIGNLASTIEGIDTFNARGPRWVSPFFMPMMLADSPAAMISITHGFRGPNMAVVTACAAGSNAIGEATRMIQRGAADVMLAGGSEAPILPIALAGFNATGAVSTSNEDPARASRPFDAERDGFVMGEGSAILVLEELDHALKRNVRIYGEIMGYGTSADAYHISAPDENGAGAVLAIQGALKDAALAPVDIDYINAHGTGTRLNDKSETLAIKKVFGESAYHIPISSTKSTHGHLLGAAGALEAIISIKALNASMVPPTINYANPDPDCDLDYIPNKGRKRSIRFLLSNSFGFGGHNAALVIGKYE